jgi:hypothetical protein
MLHACFVVDLLSATCCVMPSASNLQHRRCAWLQLNGTLFGGFSGEHISACC